MIENSLIDNLFLGYILISIILKGWMNMASLEVLNPATNEVIETLEYTSETTPNNKLRKRIKRSNLGEK